MHAIALALLIAIATVGCATAPSLPKASYAPGDRIGFLIDIESTPTHTHVGTTVFNDFSRKYAYNWNLSSEIKNNIEQSLKNAGFTGVDLGTTGIQYPDVANLIQPNDDHWRITPGRETMVQLLREQLDLKGLIVLKETRVMTALECSGGPCSERYAEGSGLYSRSFFGLTHYYAVAAYQWNVYLLNPVADAAKAEPLVAMLRIPATPMREFKAPADFKSLTEEEFASVKNAILKFTQTASTQAINSFSAR